MPRLEAGFDGPGGEGHNPSQGLAGLIVVGSLVGLCLALLLSSGTVFLQGHEKSVSFLETQLVEV